MTNTTLTRRSLVRGAAWSVPVISVAAAAPAFAASPCQTMYDYTLQWGTSAYTKTSTDLGTASVTATGAAAVSVTFASATSGSVTRDSSNLTVPTTTNIGGLGGRALRLEHSSPITTGRSNRQDLTITFGREVTGLSFSITDIDSNDRTSNGSPAGWYDRVELTGTPTSAPVATVTGAGSLASPWRHTSSDSNVGQTGSGGNVKVTYPGAVTSVVLTYWTTYAGGNQTISLTDFTFKAKGC